MFVIIEQYNSNQFLRKITSLLKVQYVKYFEEMLENCLKDKKNQLSFDQVIPVNIYVKNINKGDETHQ